MFVSIFMIVEKVLRLKKTENTLFQYVYILMVLIINVGNAASCDSID